MLIWYDLLHLIIDLRSLNTSNLGPSPDLRETHSWPWLINNLDGLGIYNNLDRWSSGLFLISYGELFFPSLYSILKNTDLSGKVNLRGGGVEIVNSRDETFRVFSSVITLSAALLIKRQDLDQTQRSRGDIEEERRHGKLQGVSPFSLICGFMPFGFVAEFPMVLFRVAVSSVPGGGPSPPYFVRRAPQDLQDEVMGD